MFHRTSQLYRIIFLAVICLVLLSSACQAAGETVSAETPKLYSPFDEKAPKMPAEFADDKRLDVKLDIAVKSTNMKDLFSEIRKVTGVNIIVASELHGERPIIFYRNKSLRDLMTDLSALYGYYWLARGRKGAWTYELFEDIVHSKRRQQVRADRESAQVEGLLRAIDEVSKTLDSPAELARLAQTNPRLHKSAADPAKQELLRVINLLGKDTLRGLLNDVGIAWTYNEMSQEMKDGILKAINAQLRNPYTPEEVQNSQVRFKRWRASIFTPPHVVLQVSLPGKEEGEPGWRWMNDWPFYVEGEPDLLDMAEPPPGRVEGDPLSSETLVTVKSDRKQLYHEGDLLLGHTLEAVARQGKLNVIADYYFQETALPEHTDEPLGNLVRETCLKMGYTCQVEKNTLRFRCNKWYLQPLPDEPPSSMQESWWRRVTGIGGLLLDDLLDIACLPGQQTYWGGFRFIPDAWQARWFPRTARMVRMLGSAFEDQACTPEGLSVTNLDADQFARLTDWAGVVGIKETQEGLRACTIRIEKTGDPVNSLQFRLVLPDGTPRSVPLTAQLERLSEEDRRTLAAERTRELSADKVELSVSGD